MNSDAPSPLPTPSHARLSASREEEPIDVTQFIDDAQLKKGTVLYLAYGSNLSVEKFRKSRGIQPLAQINVQVPSLRLTFDLPGIPYAEPCFANSALRASDNNGSTDDSFNSSSEKTALLRSEPRSSDYHKDRWHKGLIGVVYEVTAKDYAHIIETEGGGASYQDIVVDCFPLESPDPTVPVPKHPATTAFKAHTLFAPGYPPGSQPPKDGGRIQRPDPSYAQPSARYLKLITDGAAELRLPNEYQDYLHAIRPFTITTLRQRAGQAIFLGFWAPVVLSLFGLAKLVADKRGRTPKWMQSLTLKMFEAVWWTYDTGFKFLFSEGERTIGDNEEGSGQLSKRLFSRENALTSAASTKATIGLEKIAEMQSAA